MRILYITSENMHKEGGGKTHFIEVAIQLHNMDNDLLVILPSYSNYNSSAIQDHGLNISYVPTFKKNVLSYLLYEFLNIFYLSYHILKFKPDVIYARQCLFDFMHAVLARLFNVPYIMEKNGIIEDEFINRGVGRFTTKAFKLSEAVNLNLSSAIVCVTAGIKRELSRRDGINNDKMVVIPNGVNPELFKPLNRYIVLKELGFDTDYFYVGFIGSFAPWQGIDVLMAAAKKVKERGYKTLRYVLVGDGEMLEGLKKLVKEYLLTDDVLFIGRVPYNNVPIYINSADVLVIPKTAQIKTMGFSPLKLYEYLACAKPVIVSRADGLVEVVKRGACGYVFEPDDAEDLALKIIRAYNERHLLEKMGKSGRLLVNNNYTWRITAQSILKILKTYGSKCSNHSR